MGKSHTIFKILQVREELADVIGFDEAFEEPGQSIFFVCKIYSFERLDHNMELHLVLLITVTCLVRYKYML